MVTYVPDLANNSDACLASKNEEPEKWSLRRTLLFLLFSSVALWTMIIGGVILVF